MTRFEEHLFAVPRYSNLPQGAEQTQEVLKMGRKSTRWLHTDYFQVTGKYCEMVGDDTQR